MLTSIDTNTSKQKVLIKNIERLIKDSICLESSNKEYIIKHFKNRYVLLYIKYQILLSKISLFVLPFILMLGLIELFIGLYFIITHPIPYDKLPIDLHIYITK